MILIDANAILRYMLNDNTDMAMSVHDLTLRNKITVRYEVMAEVIYVLEKVYAMPRKEIRDGITVFLSMPCVEVETKDVLLLALDTYAGKKLDFVDCLLYGFRVVCGYRAFTFDKELNKLIKNL